VGKGNRQAGIVIQAQDAVVKTVILQKKKSIGEIMGNKYGHKRHKYFTSKTMMWGKFAAEKALIAANQPFVIVFAEDSNMWEINLPLITRNEHRIEYQTMLLYRQHATSWSFLYECAGEFNLSEKQEYPFPTFREAFMAVKELKGIYANLPIKVVSERGEEGVIIGDSTTDEVAAVLTYS
jgi:hypothetical protein